MMRDSKSLGHNTRIKIECEKEYAWLNSVRTELGLTWRGLMLKAEQRLLASEQEWPSGERKAEHESDVGGDGPAIEDGEVVAETEETR